MQKNSYKSTGSPYLVMLIIAERAELNREEARNHAK